MNIELYRRLLLLVTSIFVLQFIYGQSNNRLDSLIQVLHDTPDHKDKARLLLKISKGEELSDPEKSLQFSRQALQESRIAMFDSAEVHALIQIGGNLCRLNKIKEAIEIGEQVVEKASELDMLMEIADGRDIMAVAYAEVGDYDNSSNLYFKNLKLYEKLNDNRLIGRTLGKIGADFLCQQSYDKGLEYANKSLQIGVKMNDKALITDQYNNIAVAYQYGYNDLSSALQYYTKALKIAFEIDDFHQQGINMLNLGRLYQNMEKSDSALYFFEQALEQFTKLNNPVLMADCYITLGNYYYHYRDYQKGRQYASQGFNIANEQQLPQLIFNASNLLYEIYLSEHDTINAFKYLVTRTRSNDSLYVLQNQKALYKLEFQYNHEKLVKEQKLKQIRNSFIYSLTILGLLSGLVIFFLFYSRQKIRMKNIILSKEKMEAGLKFKSKELSINLMSLLKKNELISDVSQKLTMLETASHRVDLKESIIRLNHEIRQSSDDKLFQEFSVRFNETNSEFYDRLLNNFPNLTQSELKLCAYLRLNMSSKEISDLTGQRTETLEKARYRLRKKLGMTKLESNLVAFLSKI